MLSVKSWNLQKWLLVVGVFLCAGEWVQLCLKLIGRWHTMSVGSHKDAMDFLTLSACLFVLLPSQKTRWLTPIIAAIFFATAASLALRLF
jgi:hypothetical protein